MTRIFLLILAVSFAAACAATDRAPSSEAAGTDAAGVARTFLAIEGEPASKRIAEACDAARALMREGWDEAAEAARYENRLVLAAEVYRRAAGSLHCLEATMMTGAAIQRGWLPAEEPQAAARQYFRAVAFVFHDDDPPTDKGDVITAEVLLRQLQTITNLPSTLFEPAAAAVVGERDWAAEMHAAAIQDRHRASVSALLGVGQPSNWLLAYELARAIRLSAGDSPKTWRMAGLITLATARETAEEKTGLFYLKDAATRGDPIAAAVIGQHALANDGTEDALSYLLVSSMAGGLILSDLIEKVQRRLPPADRLSAEKLADSILIYSGAGQ